MNSARMTQLLTFGMSAVMALVAAVLLSSCSKHSKPNFVYMPDMAYSPAYKAQKEGAMRLPPAGTVERDKVLTQFPESPEEGGRILRNPLPRDLATLKRGQEFYNVYCVVCHGGKGMGDGPVTPRYANPPPVVSDKVRGLSDGRIFYIISRGQNRMPSYASQIDEEDRWAIVHYVRALDRAANPTAEDLQKAETW